MKTQENPHQIIKDVCKDFGISLEDILGKGKRNHLVVARKEATKRMLTAGFKLSDVAFYLKKNYNSIWYYANETNK